MPNTREKLIELLEEAEGLVNNDVPSLEQIAEHILSSDFINELQNEAYDLGIDSILRHKFGLSWDDADGLRKEIKRLQDATKWIPVTERLPEVVDTYLVVVKYKYDYEKEYTIDTDVATYNPYERAYIDDCWNTYNDWDEGQQYLHVTHWMPLPSPPKGE